MLFQCELASIAQTYLQITRAWWDHSGVMLRSPNAWRYLRHRVRGHGWQPFTFYSEPWNASYRPNTSLSRLRELVYLLYNDPHYWPPG